MSDLILVPVDLLACVAAVDDHVMMAVFVPSVKCEVCDVMGCQVCDAMGALVCMCVWIAGLLWGGC